MTGDATAEPAIDITATHVARQWKYESPFTAGRFDPTGRYVFAAAQDQTVQRWDLETDEHATFAGHESWLRGIAFSPDGQTTYTAGYDGRLLFWNTTDTEPAPTKSIAAHEGWVRWVSTSPHGEIVATAGNDNLIKLWSSAQGDLIRTLSGHAGHVYSIMFHPDGEWVLSGDLLGVVHQWEINTGKLLRSFEAKDLHTYNGGQRAHYGGIRSMSLSPDQRTLACSGLHKATNPFGAVQEPLLVLFDWETGKKIRSHEADGIDRGIAWRVVYHPDGHLIGASGGGSGGFIVFWKGEEAKEVHKFKLPNTALDLDLHPNNVDILTVHHDRHVRISRMQQKQKA